MRDPSESKTTIAALDSAIEKAPDADPPYRLYRGLRVDDPEAFVRQIAGDGSFSDAAFQSTSTDPTVASSSGNVVFVIRSSRGAPMGGLSENSAAESEVLLGRDWPMRALTEPKQLASGKWVIGLEVE